MMSVLRCGTYHYSSSGSTKYSSAKRFVAQYLSCGRSSIHCKARFQNHINDVIEVECVDVSHEGLGAFGRG
jgi:hypothetical protein